MIQAKYDWQFEREAVEDHFLSLAKKEGLDKGAARLLFERGIRTESALTSFLHPSLDDLHDPYLLHGMTEAVERIRRAIAANELILIYGDYDADGMTSAAILKEALEELGAECQVYLPNRFTDGYGPNQSVYRYYIEQEGVSLIVTVDNGVAGHEAILYAQSQGVDVIVTDHHSLPEVLPDAYAIIHPEHPEGQYPFPHLAGCGVAFKVACALLETVQVEWLDLVAIGTIADMVSLTGENRVMVQYGLSLLKKTERVGLQELFQLAEISPESLDEETVGFQIAPRLNALGRLDDPNPAIDLLTGFDDEDARLIAKLIDDKNKERKELVETIYEEAKQALRPDRAVQIVAKEGWNLGVLGIVAGRLLEEYQQPMIVLSIQEGRAKGSARSVAALNIFDALAPHPELFLAFGGHAGAAGMTLEVDQLDNLSAVLETYVVEQQLDMQQKASLHLEEELDIEEVTVETIASFNRLKPYGMDHPKPVFYLKDFQVESARTMGKDSQHLKFRIQKGKVAVDVIAFGKGAFVTEFSQTQSLELAVRLSVNQWNGQTSVQFLLEDARVIGQQVYDVRSRTTLLPRGVPVVHFDEELPDVTGQKAVVIGRLPEKKEVLAHFLKAHYFQAIYFKNELKTAYYLEGYGSREQFARLYKTIYQYPEFDVRYKLGDLSRYLNISQVLLVKMIQIFEELDFVRIQDGVMRVNKEAEKRAIEESQIYQALKETVFFQEKMALATPQEIYTYLTSEAENEQ